MNMKRMRGRGGHRHGGGGGQFRHGGGGGGGGAGGHQPMNRNHVFDSNGPDMRLRGTAQQLFEKYLQLGRDATSGGDRVMAESYFQHAEHYFRILNAMNQAHQVQQQQHQQRQQRQHNGPDLMDAAGGNVDGTGEQPELNGHVNGHAPDNGQDEAGPREPREQQA
jgi:hypothetical protein